MDLGTALQASARLALPIVGERPTSYAWNDVAQRYITADGRFVPVADVRGAIDTFIEGAGERMASLTGQLRDGTISLTQWQESMADEVKAVNVVAGVAGNGGWAQLTDNDFRSMQTDISEQLAYLDNFASQIADGKVSLDTIGVETRAASYADSSRNTYEGVRLEHEQDSGFDIEWNELGDAEDHCEDCLDATAQGEVPTGTLMLPGDRECRGNCNCTMHRKRSSDDAEVEDGF